MLGSLLPAVVPVERILFTIGFVEAGEGYGNIIIHFDCDMNVPHGVFSEFRGECSGIASDCICPTSPKAISIQ